MERIYTSEIGFHVGERVLLKGWLHNLRRLGGIDFVVLRDAGGTAQIVVEDPDVRQSLSGVLPETELSLG